MAIREMKWHVINDEECPLYWDEALVEFDTKEDAEAFMRAWSVYEFDTDVIGNYEIKECIYYTDNSQHINLSGKVPVWNEELCEYELGVIE